jgi:hypothetical protein
MSGWVLGAGRGLAMALLLSRVGCLGQVTWKELVLVAVPTGVVTDHL